jgi:membrane-associated phospholipid phosphatase
MRKIFIILIVHFLFIETSAQDSTLTNSKVYKMKYKIDIPITVGMFALNIYGFSRLNQKPTLDSLKVLALDQNDVWAFDRHVFNQSHPAPSSVYDIADYALWISYFSPALLFIDKKIRRDWLDITVLYLETQAINLNLYLWAGPVFTERVRPLVYIDEASWDYKLGQETTDSFYSGHVAMTAGASFFIAKVLSDYHPELGAKKWWLYGAALVPPAFVGYLRYRGFMHFPTDLLVGLVVGATVGVSGPQIHKIARRKNNNMSLIPYTGHSTGLVFNMKF